MRGNRFLLFGFVTAAVLGGFGIVLRSINVARRPLSSCGGSSLRSWVDDM